MATLKYVIGTSVDGADKYHLYKNSSATTTNNPPIATQSKLFDFPYYGLIGLDGNEIETTKTDIGYTGGTSIVRRPLRKITEDGIRYYFSINVNAYVSYGNGVTTVVPLKGEYILESAESFTIKGLGSSGGFVKATDGGWDLQMSLKKESESTFQVIKIRVFGADASVKGIGFGKGEQYVKVISNAYDDTHRHTEYIPLEALGDELGIANTNGICVGKFVLNDNDYDYPKMAFYDRNLKFVGGANSAFLAVYTASNETNEYYYKASASELYFTAAGVSDIASKIATNNDAKFVVFSSRDSGTADKDKVSVTHAYFPVFAMQNLFSTGKNYVYATADSSAEYFTESPASNIEEIVI